MIIITSAMTANAETRKGNIGMNFKAPLVAYILGYGRSIHDLNILKTVPSVQLQTAQIKRFAKTDGAKIIDVVFDQTTYQRTRFWLRPRFLRAEQLARAASGRVIVGDLIELLKRLDSTGMSKAWLTLQNSFPDLASGKHFETVRTGLRINADLSSSQFWRASKKKLQPAIHSAAMSTKIQKAGTKGTSLRSDMLASAVAPELREILDLQPNAGSTYVAKALNEKGIRSPMGGQWHPSSASNLLARCRKLGIIKI
jgi:hypothetical protein